MTEKIRVNIKVNNAGVAHQGFGTIAILTYKTTLFDGPSTSFTKLASAITAGFAADSPEGLAIARILQQSPHVPSVKLIKGTRPPTQSYRIELGDLLNSTAYQIKVKGEGVTPTLVSYVSDVDATETEILTNLETKLNAVVGKNYLATLTPPGSDAGFVEVVATAAGRWFSLEVLKTALLTIVQDHADPGIATDLAEAMIGDNDWYYLETLFNSAAMVESAANLIEATPFKVYVASVVDSDAENTAVDSGDVADTVGATGYKRTLLFYHRKPNEMLDAGFEGRVAPLDVGTWAGAYKTIAGCTADTFTQDQTDHLDAKKASYYQVERGRSITWDGAVGNTDYAWFDITVALDFVLDGLQAALFSVFVAKLKVGYDDADIALLLAAAEGFIDICKSDKHKIVAKGTPGDPDDPEPSLSFPRVGDIDPGERAVRNLPDGEIFFRLQGAVLTVDVGVTVTF